MALCACGMCKALRISCLWMRGTQYMPWMCMHQMVSYKWALNLLDSFSCTILLVGICLRSSHCALCTVLLHLQKICYHACCMPVCPFVSMLPQADQPTNSTTPCHRPSSICWLDCGCVGYEHHTTAVQPGFSRRYGGCRSKPGFRLCWRGCHDPSVHCGVMPRQPLGSR